MNTQEINADERIYLIKFAWSIRNGKFLTSNLGKTIKEHDPGRGIEYIKIFDPVKNTFKAISRKNILAFESWNTETIEILNKHTFFKK